MKSILLKAAIIFMGASLMACTTKSPQSNQQAARGSFAQRSNGMLLASRSELVAGADIGGSAAFSMDSVDRKRMFKALDKPVGKPTQWVSQSSGVRYSVVSTEKITINGNPYCRRYTTTASKNDRERQFSGTACVGEDSNWQAERQ